jgi:hypothetical protein
MMEAQVVPLGVRAGRRIVKHSATFANARLDTQDLPIVGS